MTFGAPASRRFNSEAADGKPLQLNDIEIAALAAKRSSLIDPAFESVETDVVNFNSCHVPARFILSLPYISTI